MAQKLHDTYGYSYDNLKVLLGGWSAWTSAGYPSLTSATPTGVTGTKLPPGNIVITVVPGGGAAATPKP